MVTTMKTSLKIIKNTNIKKLQKDGYIVLKIPYHFYHSFFPFFASESDFIDCNINKPDKSINKEYDFIYICLKVDSKKKLCDDWATWNKNWSLASSFTYIL